MEGEEVRRWVRVRWQDRRLLRAGILCQLWIGLGLCLMAVAARAEDVPRIVSVEPGRSGELVVCRLVSVGLPGERISLSMRSGLVSSIELYLDLMDEGKKVVAGNRVSYRLAFDLWEEVYSLEEGGREHRFSDLDGLVQFLADLPRLPVAPLSTLTADGRFRVRAGLLIYGIPASIDPGDGRGRSPGGAGRPWRRPGDDHQPGTTDTLLLQGRVGPAVAPERTAFGLVPSGGSERCNGLGHA